MKKLCIILTFLLLLPLSIMAEQHQQIPLYRLVMPNFIEDHCHFIAAPWKVIELNERFVNREGSEVAPQSCKGQVCWSWQTSKAGAGLFTWQLYDSTLPVKISNIKRISKSISRTIKETESLRKSSSNLVDTAQEFLESSFTLVRERGITRERTRTEQRSEEQAIETSITPMFHKYLGMAIQGPYEATYPFCLSSAVDLFFKAYDTDRVNDLVESFVIFKTVKPEDIGFSQQKTMLNRAKFLFSVYGDLTGKENLKRYAWAQATLFARLLEWPEFANVKTVVDGYIDRVYGTYTILKTQTTKDIAEKDKLLAAMKLLQDKDLSRNSPQVSSTAAEDGYLEVAVDYHSLEREKEPEVVEKLMQALNKAIESDDPILTVQFVKKKTVTGTFPAITEKIPTITEKIPNVLFFIVPAVTIGVVAILIIKRKKKKASH